MTIEIKSTVTDQQILEYNLKIDDLLVKASLILSALLCIGGVALLIFNPPFLVIVLGVPYTLGGFSMTVISFDRVNRPRADSEP